MATTSVLDICVPLKYWAKTRLKTKGEALQYVLGTVAPQLIALGVFTGLELGVLKLFCLGFLGMMIVYEFGYWDNDFIAQKRELARGDYVRKALPPSQSAAAFSVGMVARVIVFFLVCEALFLLGATLAPYLVWVISIAVTFFVHNRVRVRFRRWTFLLLYLLRFQLPTIVAATIVNEFDRLYPHFFLWFVFCGVLAMVWSYIYSYNKKQARGPAWLNGIDGVSVVYICQAVVLTPVFLICLIWGIETTLVALLMANVILYLFAFGSLRFAAEARRAFLREKVELTHAHTYFSHDADISRSSYERLLDARPELKVYLTDHEEDIDAAMYEKLKSEFGSLNERLKVGLEYPIFEQHILAHDMLEYCDVEGHNIPDQINMLKDVSFRVVWAHPFVSLRRLRHYKYVAGLLELASHVQGVEVYNIKSATKVRRIVEMGVVAWIICLLYGRRPLFVGVDSHNDSQLPWS